jgi:hypothetical protein
MPARREKIRRSVTLVLLLACLATALYVLRIVILARRGEPRAMRSLPMRALRELGIAPEPVWPPWGVHPAAVKALEAAGVTPEQVTQTIGDFDTSSGTHWAEGPSGGGVPGVTPDNLTGTDGGHPYLVDGQPYSAAVDLIPAADPPDDHRNMVLLENLGASGYAAWIRIPGRDGTPLTWQPHIHAVYAGVRMKDTLKEQIWDYYHNRNGLARHGHYLSHVFTDNARKTVWRLFLSVPENRAWARKEHGDSASTSLAL